MLDNLELIGTGFAVVMAVLASIWGICAFVGFIFTRPPKAKLAAATPAPVVAPAAEASGVPPHHLAAIAAAVAETLGAGYRIARVAAPPHKVEDWPLEGRFETVTAHRTRIDWGPTRPSLGGKTPDILRGQKQ